MQNRVNKDYEDKIDDNSIYPTNLMNLLLYEWILLMLCIQDLYPEPDLSHVYSMVTDYSAADWNATGGFFKDSLCASYGQLLCDLSPLLFTPLLFATITRITSSDQD